MFCRVNLHVSENVALNNWNSPSKPYIALKREGKKTYHLNYVLKEEFKCRSTGIPDLRLHGPVEPQDFFSFFPPTGWELLKDAVNLILQLCCPPQKPVS